MAAYICIDLKSFYASVECVERGLDPLNTNLVVADAGRTEKTICLAVTPALKQYGIPGRARLFEVIETVRRVNAQRLQKLSNHEFTGNPALLRNSVRIRPCSWTLSLHRRRWHTIWRSVQRSMRSTSGTLHRKIFMCIPLMKFLLM